MATNPSKVPVRTANEPQPHLPAERRPFGSLRREIDRLYEDFDRGFLGFPFRRAVSQWEPRWLSDLNPAVDIVSKGQAYEITAELPGLDEKDIDLKLSNGVLTLNGEKKEE